RDADDRRVGVLRIRLVVHREDRPGDRLHEERGERRRAERLKPVRVAGNLAEEEVAKPADETGPLLDPVDRIHEPLVAGVAGRPRCGGWIGYSHASGPSTCSPGKWSTYL